MVVHRDRPPPLPDKLREADLYRVVSTISCTSATSHTYLPLLLTTVSTEVRRFVLRWAPSGAAYGVIFGLEILAVPIPCCFAEERPLLKFIIARLAPEASSHELLPSVFTSGQKVSPPGNRRPGGDVEFGVMWSEAAQHSLRPGSGQAVSAGLEVRRLTPCCSRPIGGATADALRLVVRRNAFARGPKALERRRIIHCDGLEQGCLDILLATWRHSYRVRSGGQLRRLH